MTTTGLVLLCWSVLGGTDAGHGIATAHGGEELFTVVQPGESLRDVAQRVIGDPRGASELAALNRLSTQRPAAGTRLSIPGPARPMALAAIRAARAALATRENAASEEEAKERLREAESSFAQARYVEAARAADAAWRLVSSGAGEPTRFTVVVEDGGHTRVLARSGLPLRVDAKGASRPVYPGQAVVVRPGGLPEEPIVELAAPRLLTPANGAQISDSPAFLSWTAVEGATSYEIHLAGARGFSVTSAGPRLKLPALPVGEYRWSVRAVAGKTARSPSSEERLLELVREPLQLEVGRGSWQ